MGPLYHLPEAVDRQAALSEAVRVTRPGGTVICTAITRFAGLLDGLEGGLLSDPAWRASVDRVLQSGEHTNPTHHPDLFTTAYFHRPDDLHSYPNDWQAASSPDLAEAAAQGLFHATADNRHYVNTRRQTPALGR